MEKDKKYIQARNELIPIAEEFADGLYGRTFQSEAQKDDWNFAFHQMMNGLAMEMGLGFHQ